MQFYSYGMGMQNDRRSTFQSREESMRSVSKKVVRHLSIGALLWLGVFVSAVVAADKPYIEGTFPPLLAGKPYAGTTIKVPMMQGWACFQPAINLHKEFEELTGIKVELDLMPAPESVGCSSSPWYCSFCFPVSYFPLHSINVESTALKLKVRIRLRASQPAADFW